MGQTVSSVNTYCTINLKYIVVTYIDIISVILRCLHPTFSLVTFFQGMGCKLFRLVYLVPAQDLGWAVSSVNSSFTINFEYVAVRDIDRISVIQRCLHSTFSLVTFVRGVGGKLSRLVYLNPRSGFGSDSVISQFLLHHYLGICSCKRYRHYFSQAEMFTSNCRASCLG